MAHGLTKGIFSGKIRSMRQSQLFTKTRKEAPKDEVARSAQLLLRAGFVSKEAAGVYAFLPLGLRVLNKLTAIIREEMVAIGGQEVSLTALQDPAIWKISGRWDDQIVDNWFKTKLKNDTELGLSFTHEEPLTKIMSNFVNSYRDLPRYVFQFQTKFRNELRAKSGLLRGREFLMEDLYSFSASVDALEEFYELAAQAYKNIYDRVGIGQVTYRTFASGGSFSQFSDEFQTLTPAGEDTIYLAKDKSMAVNKEVYTDEVLAMLKKSKDDFTEERAIEVGNIFKLGTKYSEALGLQFADETGKMHPVVMGSYGIGVPRVLATVVEVLADEKGMVWPKTIAPFDVQVIELNPEADTTVTKAAAEAVAALEKAGFDVLHDDRDLPAGKKFADSDLIGIPTRVVVSAKTVAAKKLEVKDRTSGDIHHESVASLAKKLKG